MDTKSCLVGAVPHLIVVVEMVAVEDAVAVVAIQTLARQAPIGQVEVVAEEMTTTTSNRSFRLEKDDGKEHRASTRAICGFSYLKWQDMVGKTR